MDTAGVRAVDGGPTPTELLIVLLEGRRVIARAAVIAVVLVAAIVLALPRKYSVQLTVLPLTQGLPTGRIAGLAAQFGLAGFGATAGQSPDFYVSFLDARELRLNAASRTVSVTRRAAWWESGDMIRHDGPLGNLLVGDDEPPGEMEELAARKLAKLVSVRSDRLAGTVSVVARTRWPEVSRAIAQLYLDLLDEFNTTQRQSQAREEREFIEQRLAEANATLRTAEGAVQAFLERNRSWQASPQLVFEHDRLDRELQLWRTVSATLTDAFEQSRIDEVRDTPLITVVHPPRLPTLPDRRGLLIKLLAAASFGLVAGSLWVVLRASMLRATGTHRPESDSLSDALQATRADLARPWRLLR